MVEAMCPPRHALWQTDSVRRMHVYRGLAPLGSLVSAISNAEPDLIVPGDDLCVWHLHEIHRRSRKFKNGSELRTLIERSLGAPESFDVVSARTPFMDIARQEGIRVPKTMVINDTGDLERWISQTGLPTVLKADRTCGGVGVSIVNSLGEAERARRALQAPPRFTRAVKRSLIDQDRSLVWPSLLRRSHAVNAQEFIAGKEATSTVLCWRGSVLASLHFQVLKKRGSAGPSSVLRLFDHPDVTTAVEKIAMRLNLSGIVGFDFMIEASTGNPYLIEINPRATQVGHLSLGPGRDIPAALHACVSGQSIRLPQKATENDTIALFPQEWMRDPQSPFLRSAYHDVPWEEPRLVHAFLVPMGKKNGWFSKNSQVQVLSTARVPR